MSLRDPGSFVDANYPTGSVSGDTTGRLFRGSGTSQAAAVLSGAVALLLQAYPDLTPDQVKAALVATATPVTPVPGGPTAGQVNVAAALAAVKAVSQMRGPAAATTIAATTQSFPAATGQGSIDAARGGNYLVDADGLPLTGEVDAQGNPWNPQTWWVAASTLTSWTGGSWLGTVWTGADWSTSTGLQSARWSSARWSSARWSSADWDSADWTSARWSSARWSSARWSSAIWG
ncbi:MAG: S8 family serine peptidase [Actinobacteria bacterium]|nr:S8 family serine peptidase [Actinomycetota bacterium]